MASIKITVTAQSASNQALPAFPGAEGGGAGSVGGRGGAVIQVTNLNDSGQGSLRACVQASGPRHCVFRVAGLIPVTTGDLKVSNPFLSIDGQTAPGQIILGGPNTNGVVLRISTHDVVVRYVTVSRGQSPHSVWSKLRHGRPKYHQLQLLQHRDRSRIDPLGRKQDAGWCE